MARRSSQNWFTRMTGGSKEVGYVLLGLLIVAALYFWKKIKAGIEKLLGKSKAQSIINQSADVNGTITAPNGTVIKNPNAPVPGVSANATLAESIVDDWYGQTSNGKPWYNGNDSEDEMVECLNQLQTAADVIYASQYCKTQYKLSLKNRSLGTFSNSERQRVKALVQNNWF